MNRMLWVYAVGVSCTRSDYVPPQYDTMWKVLVQGSSCPGAVVLATKNGTPGGNITCHRKSDDTRVFRFPVGEFDIDEQVEVPAQTIIEGNANPNDPSDKTKKPDPSTQTYFVATHGVSDPNISYCGVFELCDLWNYSSSSPRCEKWSKKSGYNMQQGDAQKVRIGFLLNSNTAVRNINFQGKDELRPDDNGNVCGGAVFETPGCVSTGFSQNGGDEWQNKLDACYDRYGVMNDLITGDGKGVENVLIDSVRLNDLLLPEDFQTYTRDVNQEGTWIEQKNTVWAYGSQMAVWVPMTQDGSATRNITVKNLVSMLTRADGINLHGNVHDSLVEDCHIENTGDDVYVLWGAYANPTGIVFRNNVAINPGFTRGYGWGTCVAVFGAKEVTFTGIKCYDIRNWTHNCFTQGGTGNEICAGNSCLAYVHVDFCGSVYLPGNSINILDSDYLYIDAPTQSIAETDPERPLIRHDAGQPANIITRPTLSPTTQPTHADGAERGAALWMRAIVLLFAVQLVRGASCIS